MAQFLSTIGRHLECAIQTELLVDSSPHRKEASHREIEIEIEIERQRSRDREIERERER